MKTISYDFVNGVNKFNSEIGNICVCLRLPISNPLHKLYFIFNITQEQLIAIGIFTLLIVKNIKKECLKMFPKLW